jgi:hypothetical protein
VALAILPASAEVVILSGSVLVGRALELLLRGADYDVRFLGEPSLDRLELGESGLLDGVRLLILAPEASPRCHEAVLALIGARTVEARIEVLELGDDRQDDDRQEALVGPWEVLPWPCRTEDLKRRVMAALLDGSG